MILKRFATPYPDNDTQHRRIQEPRKLRTAALGRLDRDSDWPLLAGHRPFNFRHRLVGPSIISGASHEQLSNDRSLA